MTGGGDSNYFSKQGGVASGASGMGRRRRRIVMMTNVAHIRVFAVRMVMLGGAGREADNHECDFIGQQVSISGINTRDMRRRGEVVLGGNGVENLSKYMRGS
ncbi:hypothetical protein CBR_g78751 [Chara braunii]|uniref:Uncharacterized protein n=1 Tax=Chara braunii TaxID=69332 RepID=A0A388JKV4_CHABU|nr:hypothetical protein CBR_g78751 [Chara braunii]|eukprot:GBG45337.1 hypothetical protein CBR_g78751 [Chara braunii]